MSKKLTAKQVENAKPRLGKEGGKNEGQPVRTEISDGGSGLWLIVQPNGHKSWAVRYRVNGVPRKHTLEAISLADARVEAAEAIKQANNGNDPTKAKKAEKQKIEVAKANTFAAVAALYLDRKAKSKMRSIDQLRYRLTRLVLPQIGDKPIADLKRSQIMTALDYVEKHHGPFSADLCLSDISCVLKFHALRDDEYRLPLIPGMKRVSAKDRARDRILNDDEIKRLWATGNAFVKFLLLTACRRTEAAGMQWNELDGNVWTLPSRRNKAGVDLIRTLPKAAMAVLPKREGDYVFGNPPDRPFLSFSLLKKNLDKASGVTNWRLHDLRRSARSLMSRAGVNSDHAERVMGHKISGIRGVYDRHEFLKEKAHALETLAHEIMLITGPPKDNVSQFKRRRA